MLRNHFLIKHQNNSNKIFRQILEHENGGHKRMDFK